MRLSRLLQSAVGCTAIQTLNLIHEDVQSLPVIIYVFPDVEDSHDSLGFRKVVNNFCLGPEGHALFIVPRRGKPCPRWPAGRSDFTVVRNAAVRGKGKQKEDLGVNYEVGLSRQRPAD